LQRRGLTPKCPSLSKCVLTIEKEHWLVVIPDEANCFFFPKSNYIDV